MTTQEDEQEQKCSQEYHDDLPITSVCCSGTAYYGFCSICKDHTGWEQVCDTCDYRKDVEEPSP